MISGFDQQLEAVVRPDRNRPSPSAEDGSQAHLPDSVAAMAAEVGASPSPIGRMTTPEGIADPYPIFDELRSERPVCRDDVYGVWVCTRHAAVQQVLSDPTVSSRRSEAYWDPDRLPAEVRATTQAVYSALGQRMLMQDPPEHTATRKVMSAAFGKRAVALLRPRIADLVDELLAPVAAGGSIDVVADLAVPLSIRTIAEVLGVPDDDIGRIEGWSEDFATTKDFRPGEVGREAAALRGVEALLEYLGDLVARARAGPVRDDVLALVVDAADAAGPREDARLAANLAGLLVGGHDTTTGLVSAGLLSLLRFPAELAALQHEPDLVVPAIEELLRFESPAQWILRTTTREMDLEGCVIGPGQLVGLFLGAANRDPAVFEQPARLDVRRRPTQHFAFGRGRHLCVGAPLARIEAEVALSALVTRYRDIEPAGPAPVWKPNFAQRGLARLEVHLVGR